MHSSFFPAATAEFFNHDVNATMVDLCKWPGREGILRQSPRPSDAPSPWPSGPKQDQFPVAVVIDYALLLAPTRHSAVTGASTCRELQRTRSNRASR